MTLGAAEEVLREACRLRQERVDCALATVVRAESPTSAKAGARALVLADGRIRGWIGGGCAEPAVAETARQCLRDGRARLIRIGPAAPAAPIEGMTHFPSHCHSGGTLDIFIEPLKASPTLWVYGASPAAETLAQLSACLGFAVTGWTASRDQPDLFKPRAAPDDKRKPDFAPDFAVVATQGQGDLPALTAAIEAEAPYIGFIASRRKGRKIQQALLKKGVAKGRVDAIRIAVGIDIGAETPREIALSVLAALVAHKNRSPVSGQPAGSAADAGHCCGGHD